MKRTPLHLNHAGTSWPKPLAVQSTVAGASSVPPSEWPDLFAECSANIARCFGIPSERLLITSGGTAALTLAVDELAWQPGDRILSTHFEHHALSRHLVKLEQRGVQVERVHAGTDRLVDLTDLERRLTTAPVRLVAMTAACNVTGQLLPVEDVIDLAHRHGALVLIDASQLVGWTDIDLSQWQADLVAFAGHKALQGPWGVGGLYVAPHVRMACPTAQCRITPDEDARMPGYCDAGSVNMTALAGLSSACDWITCEAAPTRLAQGQQIAKALINVLQQKSTMRILHDGPGDSRLPTVAFCPADDGVLPEFEKRLRDHNITASIGWQCAPWAHAALGTQETGVIRVSFGPSASMQDVDRLTACLFD